MRSAPGIIKRLAIAASALAPCAAMAQATFTYSANDYQAQGISAPVPMSFSVKTVIIIAPGFGPLPQISGPTKAVSLILRPPVGAVSLLRVTLDNKLVETSLKGSSADGDLQVTVGLPASLSDAKSLKAEWKAADGSVIGPIGVS